MPENNTPLLQTVNLKKYFKVGQKSWLHAVDNVNLSIGSEVEFSNNFVSTGFYVIPTLAAKWTF